VPGVPSRAACTFSPLKGSPPASCSTRRSRAVDGRLARVEPAHCPRRAAPAAPAAARARGRRDRPPACPTSPVNPLAPRIDAHRPPLHRCRYRA
jgi:hypothetical protein